MPDHVQLWSHLLSAACQSLRTATATCDQGDVAQVARLRKNHDADLVIAALDLAQARRKAADKFPQIADRIVATAVGIEQATSMRVGLHKAKRFECDVVADLCCGIGGDTMAMRKHGLNVLGVDAQPLCAWLTKQNANTPTCVADVSDIQLNGLPFHIDPARRDTYGRRTWQIENYKPGPHVIAQLLKQSPNAAIKLGPGIDTAELPFEGELEFISERGRLVQAVLWAGKLARYDRSATLLCNDATHTLNGKPHDVLTRVEPQGYVFTIDPSVERAKLIGQLCEQTNAASVGLGLGMLTAPVCIDSPWLTAFELIEVMPWRPRRVKQWLKMHDGGLVEVKTRDKVINPDIVQRQLRGKGSEPFTVFVLRFGQVQRAIVTRRVESSTTTRK